MRLVTPDSKIRRELGLTGLPGPAFNSDEDIIRVVSFLSSTSVDEEVIRGVRAVLDPLRMVQLGLWPASIFMGDPWTVYWINGMDYATIEFWTRVPVSEVVYKMEQETTWIYKSLERRRREAISTASSFSLLLYAPELTYTVSKRPRTDMSLFRTPLNRTISRRDVQHGTVVIDGERWKVLPVTRYASGMSRGLYYDEETPETVCGTFYYYEPESTTYLAYKTEFRAFNKTDACLKLGIYDDRGYDIADMMYKHVDGTYPRDLIMTRDEVYAIFPFSDLDPEAKPDARYAGEYLELYGQEDVWDQSLCTGARQEGYDVVVLENMVGMFQIVTEVLDTRSREESFSSLLYLVD